MLKASNPQQKGERRYTAIKPLDYSPSSGLTENELKNAKRLCLHNVIQEEAVRDTLMETLCQDLTLKPGRQGINHRHVEVLCANLKTGKARSMSRTRNKWSGIPPEYNPLKLGYRMVEIVDLMEDRGYLEQKRGFHDRRRGIGFDTRLKPTPMLMELIDKITVIKHPDAPLLVLKDPEGNLIRYRDTGNTRSMKAQLRRYNRLLSNTVIEMDDRELNPAERYVYRVFNHGRWSQGGRFYGAAWHTCKKKSRDTIRINGDPTTEPDYSALHPTIMYGMAKIPMPDTDLYDLPGINDRDYGKSALLMMINAKNRRSAAGAYYEKFRGDTSRPKASEVFDKILEKHPPEIQQMFFSGIGLKLQNTDSKITADILDTMTRASIPCLSVHDSYRVQIQHKERLMEVMATIYIKHIGKEAKVPKIH